MNCRLCQTESEYLFDNLFLNKHRVAFFRCSSCNFLQTEEPYWLAEAYESGSISALDVGIVRRNLDMSDATENLINKLSLSGLKFLDYGGGTGLFVRLMRDRGFNFYWQDSHGENIFARLFSLDDLENNERNFCLVTAFEVFEHFVDPMQEINKLFDNADTIFFSTLLQPENLKELKTWWYLSPETGQHVSFYTTKALRQIADYFNASYYTDGNTCHLMSKSKLSLSSGLDFWRNSIKKRNLLARVLHDKLPNKTARGSLIERDYAHAKLLIGSLDRKNHV